MLTICGHLLAIVLAGVLTPPQSRPSPPETERDREARLAALRARAKESIEQERQIYSESQVKDIEARYRLARQEGYPDDVAMFVRSDAGPTLEGLIRDYPKSNRSGCAALILARRVPPAERGRHLRQVIVNHNDAWCESGVQVGGLARALLAVHYAGLERYDLAERLAQEVITSFPDSIDDSGAPLRDLVIGIRLLRDSGRGRTASR
jgi:hypothetical protein